MIGEETMHLLSRLDVELLRVELEAVWVVHRARRLDAEQNLVGAGVVVGYVVRVVGRNERNLQLALHAIERLANRLIRIETVILHLEEEVALAEHVLEGSGCLL